jgi:RNA polymerase sigma factor (sigma-70 family)
MPTAELDSSSLNLILLRMRAGDKYARDDLVKRTQKRLERLASRMLRGYPGVHRWEQTQDVLQNAFVRLFRSLEEARPKNTRELFSLAAENIRRELIDLTRRYYGPEGLGANHASGVIDPNQPVDSASDHEPIASDPTGDDLERWRAFHEAVALLPAEERETFGLAYYHGWTHLQIADLFQCSEKTVSRNWQSACRLLKDRLRGTWADPE